jgi:hypothetical protein
MSKLGAFDNYVMDEQQKAMRESYRKYLYGFWNGCPEPVESEPNTPMSFEDFCAMQQEKDKAYD